MHARGRWIALLGLTTLVLLLANRALLAGQAAGIFDVNEQNVAYYVFVADHARAGHFVGWDPWTDAGLPAMGDPQIGAYSPLRWVMGLITGGATRGFILYWMLMWWLGGLGVFLLGRHLKAPAWGACAVALGFLFSGLYIGQAQHTSHVVAFTFLPWILWRVDAAVQSGRWRVAAEAGALWGMSALAGYPGLVIITFGYGMGWAAGRWLIARLGRMEGEAGPPPAWRMITLGALAASVGLVVLAPTYVGYLYEGAGVHARSGPLGAEIAVRFNALEPGALATLFSPYLQMLGLVNWETLWPQTDPTLASVYAGLPVLALAAASLAMRPRSAWRWWVLGLGLASLAAAMGTALPVRQWLYDWIYPTRYFKHAAIFRDYFMFSLCVLALIGSRDLDARLREHPVAGRARVFGALAALGALSAAAVWGIVRSASSPAEGLPWAWAHQALVWGMLLGAAGCLFAWKWRVRHLAPALIVAAACVDAAMVMQLAGALVATDDPAMVQRWRSLDARHVASLAVPLERRLVQVEIPGEPYFARSMDQLIVKTPVLSAYTVMKNSFLVEMIKEPVVRRAMLEERMWFSPRTAQVPLALPVYEAFLERTRQLGAWPLVIHSPRQMLDADIAGTGDAPSAEAIAALEAAAPAQFTLERYAPAALDMRVTAPEDGWLLVTDRWARSWQASVNGRPAEVWGANFAFRAIEVPRGESLVQWRYHTPWVPWLVAGSWTMLVIVFLAPMVVRRKA